MNCRRLAILVVSAGAVAFMGTAVAGDRTAHAAVVTTDLSITKTHVPAGDFLAGADGTYLLTVTNRGPDDSVGVITVRDTLPAPLSFVSAAGGRFGCAAMGAAVTCTRADVASGTPSLTNGSTETITLTTAVAPGADWARQFIAVNTATVTTTDGDPSNANNSSTDTVGIFSVADPDIAVTHSGHLVSGQNVSYRLTVLNQGPSTTSGLEVDDPLAPESGLSLVSVRAPGWKCSQWPGIAVQCFSGLLPPGFSSTITVVARVDAASGSIVKNAVLVQQIAFPDPNPPDNTATDAARVIGGTPVPATGAGGATLIPIGITLLVFGGVLLLGATPRRSPVR